jgi:hypothetical protein
MQNKTAVMTWKQIVEIAASLGLLVAAAVAYGRFTARLDDMDRRIAALEKTAQPGTRLADICLQLITEQASTGDTNAIQEQMNRFHCYERVAANTRATENSTGAAADLNAVSPVNATDAVQNR